MSWRVSAYSFLFKSKGGFWLASAGWLIHESVVSQACNSGGYFNLGLLLKLEPKLPEENNEFQDDMHERKIQCSSEATGIAIAVAIIAARCREFDEGRRGKGTLTTVHELKWAASMELKSRIERVKVRL